MTWQRSIRQLTLYIDATPVADAKLPDDIPLALRTTSIRWMLGRSSAREHQPCSMTDIFVLSRAADAASLRRIAVSNRPSVLAAKLFALPPSDALSITFDDLHKVAARNKGKERLVEQVELEHEKPLPTLHDGNVTIEFVGALSIYY